MNWSVCESASAPTSSDRDARCFRSPRSRSRRAGRARTRPPARIRRLVTGPPCIRRVEAARGHFRERARARATMNASRRKRRRRNLDPETTPARKPHRGPRARPWRSELEPHRRSRRSATRMLECIRPPRGVAAATMPCRRSRRMCSASPSRRAALAAAEFASPCDDSPTMGFCAMAFKIAIGRFYDLQRPVNFLPAMT